MKYRIGDRFSKKSMYWYEKKDYIKIVGYFDKSYRVKCYDMNGIDLVFIGTKYKDVWIEYDLDYAYEQIGEFPWTNDNKKKKIGDCPCSGYDLLHTGHKCGRK